MKVCPKCDLRHFDTSYSRCLMCHTELVEAPDPRIGSVLGGRYRLEEVIGEGGMAIVYLARHTLMERPYAVKVLHGHFSGDDDLVERMRREARMTAALTHPNIIEIYDFGLTDDGCPYIVMELLKGKSLRDVLRQGRIGIPRLIDLATQMAQGLARAHDFGVVHRDLKPENVFVMTDSQGRDLVKIVDFGIARQPQDTHLTHRGEIIGTPQYMAPDRALSRDVTPSSDLYSLGVVLYEMATGALPFQASSPTGYVLKHMHEMPRPASERASDVPPELDRLIADLMEKDPSGRPVDAHKVVDRLHALDTGALRFEPKTTLRTEQSPLEHTSTLNGWVMRTTLFERMVGRAYGENAPAEVLSTLAAIRDGVGRLRALREKGVRAQRALDELEVEMKKKAERLGHAVHVLAIDLSRAREEEREARTESEARIAATEQAKVTFHDQLGALEQLDADRPEHPGDEVVTTARALAEAAEQWQRADQAAERSRSRAARSAAEVADLGFQIDALRGQLEKLEQGQTDDGANDRALLETNEAERHQVEEQLVKLTDRLVGPLRSRKDLGELFVALEGTVSRPTAPLPNPT
ncbi:MAG: protein kinase [Sandaracinaceae bacterium]